MARLSKREWFEEGFAILSEHGADGLTIEALARNLSVTKGSFYHHFQSMQAYADALLEHWRATLTREVIAQAETAEAPEAILDGIVAHMVALAEEDDPELAIRDWATRDERVRRVVASVDAERLEYGARLLRARAGSSGRALLMSRILYALMLGCSQISSVGLPEWTAIYREFKRWLGPPAATRRRSTHG